MVGSGVVVWLCGWLLDGALFLCEGCARCVADPMVREGFIPWPRTGFELPLPFWGGVSGIFEDRAVARTCCRRMLVCVTNGVENLCKRLHRKRPVFFPPNSQRNSTGTKGNGGRNIPGIWWMKIGFTNQDRCQILATGEENWVDERSVGRIVTDECSVFGWKGTSCLIPGCCDVHDDDQFAATSSWIGVTGLQCVCGLKGSWVRRVYRP